MKFTLRKKQTSQVPLSRENKNLNQIKWLNIVNIFLMISILAITIWFVYTNIYQTIGKVQVLLLSDTNLTFEPIDFKLFNTTKEIHEKRKQLPEIYITRDPFYETVSSTEPALDNIVQINQIQGQL